MGTFTSSEGPYGTFDMNGNIWEILEPESTSPTVILRGGGWTSFFAYLQSTFRIGGNPEAGSPNGGFRLASNSNSSSFVSYELVKIGDPDNKSDKAGYGPVDAPFWIEKYEATIIQSCAFLNAIATTDS